MADAKSARITFRVPGELAERMREAAEDESRTLSNWLVATLKRVLAERDDTG
jgi:hypothetical protein